MALEQIHNFTLKSKNLKSFRSHYVCTDTYVYVNTLRIRNHNERNIYLMQDISWVEVTQNI